MKLINQPCHGHENNVNCQKCQFYDKLSMRWNLNCPENKEILQNYFKTEQKKEKLLQSSSQEKIKINATPLNFHKKDFYYSFNDGFLFSSLKNEYVVKLFNADTGNLIMNTKTIPGKIYNSFQKFYVKWRLEVYYKDKLFLETQLDLNNEDVLIFSDSGCLGDNISWIESVIKFKEKHNCNVTFYCHRKDIAKILSYNYPEITVTHKKNKRNYYATYHLLAGNLSSIFKSIVYDRIVSLEKIPQYVFNLQEVPKIRKFKTINNIDFGGDYICYSETASSEMKQWNNPQALKETIKYIQSLGLKVVNIDIKPNCKNIDGVIYLNGKNHSLQDRVDVISNAKFFMGMASGLSWLAWACHKPAIVISGFSLPISEYDNPYRVFNTDYCFGCWNLQNSFNCANQQYAICNKSISSKQVIKTINKLLTDIGYEISNIIE